MHVRTLIRASIATAFALTLAAAATGCSPRTTTATNEVALADTLKDLIENAYDFTRPDVVTRMTALYPDTGGVVSASGGQLVTSPDSLRAGIAAFWDNVGRNMRTPRWVWNEVHVTSLGPDGAVLTATWSIPHIAPNNQPHTISGAWTAVFRRFNGGWKIVHEHLSVPE